jgi:hypothetical protein
VPCHSLKRCFVWLNDVISGRRLKFKLKGWFRRVVASLNVDMTLTSSARWTSLLAKFGFADRRVKREANQEGGKRG